MRTTKAHPDECPGCNGLGYNDKCAPEMEMRFDPNLRGYVEVKTIKQGSGCLRCGGKGRLRASQAAG